MIWNSSREFSNFVVGSAFGALIAIGIVMLVIFLIAAYIYISYAWMIIAKKLRYKKPWFAWVPVLNIIMMLQLGAFSAWWTLLLLIPILGWIAVFVLVIIATWRIFELRNYPGWYSLSLAVPKFGIVLYMIALGFVAWNDKKNTRVSARTATRKVKKKKRR